jgi:L-rhamnose isomerase / sugar isomerase
MNSQQNHRVFRALETFRVELPSWGFANTGTRFGKFIQPAVATTIEEKFSDARQVHRLAGICPTMALHVQWDCPNGASSTAELQNYARQYSIQPGSINPNLFQDESENIEALRSKLADFYAQRTLTKDRFSLRIARTPLCGCSANGAPKRQATLFLWMVV